VHDHHAVHVRRRAADDVGDERSLVVGRDDGHHLHVRGLRVISSAGSVNKAATSDAPIVATEASPSEYSGTYSERMSVPKPTSVVTPASCLAGPTSAVARSADAQCVPRVGCTRWMP